MAVKHQWQIKRIPDSDMCILYWSSYAHDRYYFIAKNWMPPQWLRDRMAMIDLMYDGRDVSYDETLNIGKRIYHDSNKGYYYYVES